MNLRVYLWGWERSEINAAISILSWFNESSLDQAGDLLNMGLSADSSFDSAGFDTILLLNSKYQTYWDESFSKFADDWSIGWHAMSFKIKN